MKHIITAICYDKRGRVLSVGRNSYIKTHPMQARIAKEVGQASKIYLHAEMDAILKVRDWNKIHKMTVVRRNKEGHPMCAAPCSICQRMIELVGIKYVEHT